ncbi:hypothetical protein FA95DRAFT_1611936 [Auriscalpium vulgare]|uniref:Uncharacterized protein n=1 Tax=Auriscalpium vulgare TaxID=40419 RepID=A0ACB8R8A8_9AGAM|nr:hypothetical protein FA95DRAFT_1611936 [Auriscalpium vulgare]
MQPPAPPPRSTRPHLSIPLGARQPEIPSPSSSWAPYAFELNGQANSYDSLATGSARSYDFPVASPMTPYASPRLAVPDWQRPRTTSSFSQESATFAFPEPQMMYRSSSQSSPHRPMHRNSKSDAGFSPPPPPPRISSRSSVASFSSYSTENAANDLPELAKLSLDTDEGLARFQAGKVPEQDEEWSRFVPPQAQEAVGKHEVQRQSVLFEVFKSEKDYVSDLELFKEIFIEPLRNSGTQVMSQEKMKGFTKEVFGNIEKILANHQRMLGSLFNRQREQHPLVQSVADIILDNALIFMPEYETYIKHSPISMEYHRKELKRNPKYQVFIQACTQDPRLQRRDFKTFVFRPVTRLPRLKLIMERVEALTDVEHPDKETIPLVLAILGDLIRSTEPGIVSAEDKVKFWSICESLVYSRGEIIDMDLYDDSRTLMHSGTLSRKQRSDSWHAWTDLMGALLDNYFLLLKEETRPNGGVKRQVVSRPIPLEYLRLESFKESPESRRERPDTGFIMGSTKQEIYPFTIHHAGAKGTRRYTLYTTSAASRQKWYEAFVDAIGVRKVRQEANMWFSPQPLNDGFFRIISPRIPFATGTRFTGRVTCAAPFSRDGRNYLVVGCSNGIYIGQRADNSFHKALAIVSPTSMVVLPEFNKVIIHQESVILSYSLDLLLRVSQGLATVQSLEASMEKVTTEGTVLFFRVGHLANRTLVVYASKSFLQVTLHTIEVVKPGDTSGLTPLRASKGSLSYRPFGSPAYVSRNTHDVAFLPSSVGICSDKGITVLNPTNLSSSSPTVVPNFSDASVNLPMSGLKSRCDACKVLGLVRCDSSELLVIYDEMGCYIDKYGKPARSSGYVRWECKIASYVRRGMHILLFSSEFIEVRNVNSGRLVQVIEGQDMRLLHSGLSEKDMVVIGRKGRLEDKTGLSEALVELVQTSEISTPAPASAVEGLWDEWDMS